MRVKLLFLEAIMNESLLFDVDKAIAILTINDEPYNRMSLDFMDQLESAVKTSQMNQKDFYRAKKQADINAEARRMLDPSVGRDDINLDKFQPIPLPEAVIASATSFILSKFRLIFNPIFYLC